jgi:hypothetical protein
VHPVVEGFSFLLAPRFHHFLGLDFQAGLVPTFHLNVAHARIDCQRAIGKHAQGIMSSLAEFIGAEWRLAAQQHRTQQVNRQSG